MSFCFIYSVVLENHSVKNSPCGKDLESKQSSTKPDPGHHMGKWPKHIQASQEVSHFQAGDHKAAMKKQESMTNTKLSLNTLFIFGVVYISGGGGGYMINPLF